MMAEAGLVRKPVNQVVGLTKRVGNDSGEKHHSFIYFSYIPFSIPRLSTSQQTCYPYFRGLGSNVKKTSEGL